MRRRGGAYLYPGGMGEEEGGGLTCIQVGWVRGGELTCIQVGWVRRRGGAYLYPGGMGEEEGGGLPGQRSTLCHLLA